MKTQLLDSRTILETFYKIDNFRNKLQAYDAKIARKTTDDGIQDVTEWSKYTLNSLDTSFFLEKMEYETNDQNYVLTIRKSENPMQQLDKFKAIIVAYDAANVLNLPIGEILVLGSSTGKLASISLPKAIYDHIAMLPGCALTPSQMRKLSSPPQVRMLGNSEATPVPSSVDHSLVVTSSAPTTVTYVQPMAKVQVLFQQVPAPSFAITALLPVQPQATAIPKSKLSETITWFGKGASKEQKRQAEFFLKALKYRFDDLNRQGKKPNKVSELLSDARFSIIVGCKVEQGYALQFHLKQGVNANIGEHVMAINAAMQSASDPQGNDLIFKHTRLAKRENLLLLDKVFTDAMITRYSQSLIQPAPVVSVVNEVPSVSQSLIASQVVSTTPTKQQINPNNFINMDIGKIEQETKRLNGLSNQSLEREIDCLRNQIPDHRASINRDIIEEKDTYSCGCGCICCYSGFFRSKPQLPAQHQPKDYSTINYQQTMVNEC